MTTNVVSVAPQTLIEDALDLMLRHNISGLVVVDEQRQPLGVISEYDILQLYRDVDAADASLVTCNDYMSTDLVTIQDHASLSEAAELLLKKSVRRLIVLAGERFAGLLARRDVARWIRDDRMIRLRKPENAEAR